MQGDSLKDKREGDPNKPSAVRHNLVNRVLRERFGNILPQSGQPGSFDTNPCVIPVQNNSTNTISRYGILGIDSDVIDGTSYPDAYQNQGVLVNGVTPVVPDHSNCFAIAVEPIQPGFVGRCVISGVSIALVSIASTNDACADIADGDSTQLLSGDSGAQIINSPGVIGQQLCVVRLGGQTFPKPQYQGMVLQAPANNSLVAQFLEANYPASGTSGT